MGGSGVWVKLWSGVVPRDRKSGESVSLGMGHEKKLTLRSHNNRGRGLRIVYRLIHSGPSTR